MQKFRLKGIAHPGRVNLFRIGTVELANISDELALQIWESGCPYLEPLPEYRAELFPGETPITVKPILSDAPPKADTGRPSRGTRKNQKNK